VVKKKFQRTPPSVPSRKQNIQKKRFQINPQGYLPKKKCQKKVPKKVGHVYPKKTKTSFKYFFTPLFSSLIPSFWTLQKSKNRGWDRV
jgi:hypothetical protein